MPSIQDEKNIQRSTMLDFISNGPGHIKRTFNSSTGCAYIPVRGFYLCVKRMTHVPWILRLWYHFNGETIKLDGVEYFNAGKTNLMRAQRWVQTGKRNVLEY